MRYPIEAEEIPGSGGAIYLFLLNTVRIPGKLPHEMWFNGLENAMKDKTSTAFRGFFPIGQTMNISYAGSPFGDHKFTGEEKNNIFVSDLSKEAKMKLAIPKDAKDNEKVFNPLYKPYEQLDDDTIKLNELPALSLAKSISSWCCQKSAHYTEVDVVNFLITAINRPSSKEMLHILNGNHIAWCTHRFMLSGSSNELEEDIKKEFYAQNSPDFYIKDLGTIMPSLLYVLALLGTNVGELVTNIKYDLWGIESLATSVTELVNENLKNMLAA